MKIKILIFYIAVLPLIIQTAASQTVTIWSEDFSYPDNTVTGQGNPAIASWTADGQQGGSGKGILVVNNKLEGFRTSNPGLEDWIIDSSDPIEIDGFANVSVTIALSSNLKKVNGDEINVYYSIDEGSEVAFPGSPFTGNFGSATASVSGLSGNTLALRIQMLNDDNKDYYYADDIVVTGELVPSNWTGNVSNFWNSTGNWSTGTVPQRGNALTIPTSPVGGNFPEDNAGAGALCYNLTIESGAHLYVPSDNSLEILGSLTNNAGTSGLILRSDASGTASLVHNSSGVNARVEQYLTPNVWHYVSSPISNATANVFFGIYLKSFNEPTYTWNPNIVDPATPLTTMLGYAAWVDGSTATVAFEGTMNNGFQSIGITYTTPQTNEGWNLIGNPFPSSLDWDAESGWNRSGVDATIYFWQGVGGSGNYPGNYHYYTGTTLPSSITPVGTGDATRFIPPNQGFFIRTSSTGTISVNNDARVHSTQSYWKSKEVTSEGKPTPTLRFTAVGPEGYMDEAIVRFYPEATVEHDGAFDAFKLPGYLVPQIYSLTPSQTKLAINTLPEYHNGTVIPLAFTASENGIHSIELTEMDGFLMEPELYLEDLSTNTVSKLDPASIYSFMANTEEDPDRFLLHFGSNEKNGNNYPEQVKSINAHSYAYQKSIYVQIEEDIGADVAVFNLLGQKVAEINSEGIGIVRIDLEEASGYFIVMTITISGIHTEKVFVK